MGLDTPFRCHIGVAGLLRHSGLRRMPGALVYRRGAVPADVAA